MVLIGKPTFIECISRSLHPKGWRGLYKHLLCLKKLLQRAIVMSTLVLDNQNPFLSLPCDTDAVTSVNSEIVSALGELVQIYTRQAERHL